MHIVKYVVAFVVIVGLIYAGLAALDVYSPEAFSYLAAGVLAGAFERFKWLKEAWDDLTPDGKRLGMWIMLFVVIAGAYLLSCLAVLAAFACTGAGAVQALITLFIAVTINQGVHRLIKTSA